jgi:LDH2 family malate/lactate/ureidoglycolate dehydrogenase
MAIYPVSDTDVRVDATTLRKLVVAIFFGCDMSANDAELLTESLVHADLRGIHSHGVLRVPEYVKKLTVNGVNPRGIPHIASDRGAAMIIDADNSMGQIAGIFAMRAAIDRAREIGVAFAGVRHSNHCGAMDWYTLAAARADMVGIAGTNALPTMAPWGGIDKVVGINPLSIAFPAETGGPFVFDFSFGGTAHGKLRVYHQKGSPIPESWAFDKEGRPTTVAAEAIEGLIQPVGQHKGVGLAMAVGMLSTLLSGASYGSQSGNMIEGARPGADGHFFMAINPDFFMGALSLRARVDEIVDEIHGSRKSATVTRLLVPGEIEAEIEMDYCEHGILLSADTLAGVAEAARSLQIRLPPGF